MRLFLQSPRSWLRLFWLPGLLLAVSAHAGNISFNLTVGGNKLTLINQGDSPAFDPAVLRLLSNGHWEILSPAPGTSVPVEFKPQARMDFAWPERPAPATPTSIESLRPVMVRFFDQACAGFGQISFFNQPQPASGDLMLDAVYVDGLLRIKPPKNPAIKASWLVWPQEQGIAALAAPLKTPHTQPDAKYIQWSADSKELNLDLGKGMPTAFLLQETPQGLRLQVVPTGRAPGRQQRTAWLDRGAQFRTAAMIALLAGLGMLAWHLAGARQRFSINP
jgi:hypothetical protein